MAGHQHGASYGQEVLVAVLVAGKGVGAQAALVHATQFPDHGLHAGMACSGFHKLAAAGLGDAHQGGGVELGDHRLAFAVFLETHHASPHADRDRCALPGAEADRVHNDAFLGGLPSGSHGVIVETFAITDHDDGLALGGIGPEALAGLVDGGTDHRALGPHQIGSQGIQEDLGSPAIGGDGHLGVGFACEHHDAEPVAAHAVHQLCKGTLGHLHAVRLDILGQHAVAHVQGHHHVHSLGGHFFQAGAHLRAGQGENGEGEPMPKQKELQRGAPGGDARNHVADERIIAEAAQGAVLQPEAGQVKGHQHGPGGQGPQHLRALDPELRQIP